MDKIICCNTILFTTLLTASYLGFGIANVYISAKNTGAKNECGIAIWYCNVIMAVLDFIAFIGMLVYLATMYNKSTNKHKSTKCSIIALGINIWACVAYFSIDTNCKDFYLANYPQVWHMLEANVVYLFTIIGAVIVMYISTICLVLCAKKENTDV